MMEYKKKFATTLKSERGRFILNKVLNQDYKNDQLEKFNSLRGDIKDQYESKDIQSMDEYHINGYECNEYYTGENDIDEEDEKIKKVSFNDKNSFVKIIGNGNDQKKTNKQLIVKQ